MKKIWNHLSYLGLEKGKSILDNRNIILSNRINLFLSLTMLLLTLFTTIIRELNNAEMTIQTKRLLILFFLTVPNYVFSARGYHKITKVALVFVPVLIIVFLPPATGYVDEIDFIHGPLAIIVLSLVPQLILKPSLKNPIYTISLLYFLFQLLFIDELYIMVSEREIQIINSSVSFRFYYKLGLMAVFFFLHASVFYLRRLNYMFENHLEETNEELSSTLEELQTTQQHLIQSEKMVALGTLTAGVAHEINNPLNFINGGLELIRNIRDDLNGKISAEQVKELDSAIEISQSGVSRASGIVKSLMTFSYRGKPVMVSCDIHEIINNTLLFLNTKFDKGIKVRKNFGLKINVPGYPDKLHQVFLNILDNAIQAVLTNKDKTTEKYIIITTMEENGECRIDIENNGPQIPDDSIQRIFDPFFTTKEPGKGTGLGLAISYSLVQDHKGKIKVKNSNEGVCFSVFLPLSPLENSRIKQPLL